MLADTQAARASLANAVLRRQAVAYEGWAIGVPLGQAIISLVDAGVLRPGPTAEYCVGQATQRCESAAPWVVGLAEIDRRFGTSYLAMLAGKRELACLVLVVWRDLVGGDVNDLALDLENIPVRVLNDLDVWAGAKPPDRRPEPEDRPTSAPPARLSERVAIIGSHGTGKSSTALSAARAGFTVVDFDEQLEKDQSTHLAELFVRAGPQEVRRRYAELCRAHLDTPPSSEHEVLVLGASALLERSLRALVATFGTVIWMDADTSATRQRLISSHGHAGHILATMHPAVFDAVKFTRDVVCYPATLRIDTTGITQVGVEQALVECLEPS
jgi:shikimate kinase